MLDVKKIEELAERLCWSEDRADPWPDDKPWAEMSESDREWYRSRIRDLTSCEAFTSLASLPLAGDVEGLCARLREKVIWSGYQTDCIPDQTALEAERLIRSLAGRVEAAEAAEAGVEAEKRAIPTADVNAVMAVAASVEAERNQLRTALAVEKRAKEEAQAACAFFADEGTYSDSYGVPGSDFGVCRFCEAGGAPGVPFEHNKRCPILRCEEVSAEWWAEREEERKDLAAAEARSAALARALEEAEACMSIVEPRSDKAEYVRILGVVRDALKARAIPEPGHEG